MAATSPTFSSFAAVRAHRIWPGTLAYAIQGESVQFALIELDPGVEVQEHSHPNEQVGFIIEGTFSFTIGGETRELKPGDTYVIAGNVRHSAKAGPTGTVALDIFSPPRADWERLEREEPRRPAWPRESTR